MQVAVEHPVQQRAFHEGDHACANHGFGVDAGIFHASHIVELETFEALHHDHAASDQLGMWSGNHITVLLQVGQDAGDVEHVGCLETKVEFFNDGLGKQFNERWWVGQGRHLDTTH